MTAWTVIDDVPSRRFPVYTRGNSGEVFPNVMTPLTGSLIGDASADGQRRAMLHVGLAVPRDLAAEETFGTGVFGGYLYGNLSLIRVASGRAPGLTPEDADRQIAGVSSAAPPHRRRPGDRSLRATVRSSAVMGRAMLRPDISEVDRARDATETRRAVARDPSALTDGELLDVARSARQCFADGMCRLLTFSGYAAASAATLEKLATHVAAPAGTVTTLTAGLGTIDSASPAFALWRLGRIVGASPTLMLAFDDGVDLGELEARADPAVADFVAEFAEFRRMHGARGPDEWELASPTWGSDPNIALAAIDRLRHAPDERDPVAAGKRLAQARAQAITDVRGQLRRPLRPMFDRIVDAAAIYAEGRERAKAVFVEDMYPTRLALFELADRARDRGGPVERRDCFLVTVDELEAFVADPVPFAEVIEERGRRRDHLQEREPPFVFDGELPPPSTWPLRSAPTAPDATSALHGQGVCPGVARGTVRIVHDPAEPGDLRPGDILVAPITDPAWTPLFLAARGVVVDVGAQQSHAAIVARELGIPAIVGVERATTRLTDGQLIEIDGSTGSVTVLNGSTH